MTTGIYVPPVDRSAHKLCACGSRIFARCSLCDAALCVWHRADQPTEDAASDGGVRLRTVCLPACGAPMTGNWAKDVETHQRQKRDARSQAGMVSEEVE